MDEGGPAVSIIWFVVLLAIEIIFYGFGAAIQMLNASTIREKVTEENDKKSKRILLFMETPVTYINTIQVVVTFVNIVMGAFYLKAWNQVMQYFVEYHAGKNFKFLLFFGQKPLEIAVLIVTGSLLIFILLTIGVYVPKRIAEKYPDKWTYLFIHPIYLVTILLKPITGLVSVCSKPIMKVFGISTDKDMSDVTEEEIISMLHEGHEQGVLQESEVKMINNIFEFSDKEAHDIMTHRSNIVGIDGNTTLKAAVNFMLNEGKNSRYPVYIDNIDHIIGIIHLKDAFTYLESGNYQDKPIKSIKKIIREARFIPETRNIDALFKTMQATKIHMVIVIDEYGQTSGLVAMEDILEEIVGNILDEYDDEEVFIKERGVDKYEIDGLTRLEDLEEKLNIHFEEDDFETLNGLMISYLEHIPEENEIFDMDYEGYNFKVLSVKNKVISRVLVTKKE